MSRGGLCLAAIALVFAVGACGDGQGLEEGAEVTVYAAAGACPGAKRELARAQGGPTSVRVRVSCLPEVRRDSRLDLAAVGANARRAAEDSTTIGYIGELDPAATRFSETILEEANIAQLPNMSGATAMKKLLKAVGRADTSSESLRESVREQLQR